MHAITTSYLGPERTHHVADRLALVALQVRAKQEGLSIVRIEVSTEEATNLLMEFAAPDIDDWVHFGTICGIPFVVVKDREPCYSI